MSIHHLFDILLSYGPLPPKLLDKGFIESLKSYLIPVLATSAYAKRQLLLSAGQVCEYIYFLEEGLARGSIYTIKPAKRSLIFYGVNTAL